MHSFKLNNINFFTKFPSRYINIKANNGIKKIIIGRQFKGLINEKDGNYIEIIEKDKKIFIFRDKFGSIPLYYRTDEFTISTSLKFLIKENEKLSNTSISQYISKGVLIESNTPYLNIKKLCPFENIKYEDNKLSVYEIKDYFPNKNKYEKFSISLLEKIISKSIKNIYSIEKNTKKLLVNLSGGNDSSLLLSLLLKYGINNQSIISNTFYHKDWRKDFDDWYWADKVSKTHNIKNILHEIDVKKFNKQNLEFINSSGGLYHTYGTAFNYQTEDINKDLDEDSIIINGSGPDEVIIGTEKIDITNLNNFENSFDFFENYINSAQDYNKLSQEIVNDFFIEKNIDNEFKLTNLANKCFNFSRSFADNQRFFHSLFILQDHISTLTAAADSSSKSIIFPFLTNDFFDICFSSEFKILNYNNIYKKCIKDILSKYLSREIVYRKKIGFQSPSRIYFANKNMMGVELLNRIKKGSSILNIGKLIKPINHRLFGEFNLKERYDFLEWNVLNILRLEDKNFN